MHADMTSVICEKGKAETKFVKGKHTNLVDWQRAVWGVVDSVTHHLSVWLLRFIPVDDGRCGAEHTTSDLQSKQGGITV